MTPAALDPPIIEEAGEGWLIPAHPRPLDTAPGALRLALMARRSLIAPWTAVSYTAQDYDFRLLRRQICVFNDPASIRAVCLDEARDGQLMAPLSSRLPHAEGNLAIAAKLARRTGCSIALWHVTRQPEGRFRVNFFDAITLPESPSGVLDDVAFLNAIIEPVVLDHLDQWFRLNNAF
ncbi:MAG: hypothetical protein ING09_12840 [Roseomonas sp.]|nr:hypothetical protein [Rubrivivax sp.]MCA3287428.1 hypothetical protein [Roseomonas sp.]MCA3291913.1 hypothetical protein [Roseomonas sp.]MCA3295275.1 hypothetical protein [Roseomonas sp.]